MNLPEILARIEERLEALGLKADAVSKLAKKPDAIRNIRRAVKDGKRTGVSTATVSALAVPLQCSVAWLLTGDGNNAPNEVPLVGYVGAGAEAHLFAEGQGPFDMVDAPEGATSQTVAVQIRGQSLGELFDQWLVYYDDVHDPPTSALTGKLCVVGLSDGRVLVKKLEKGHLPGMFTLRSNTEPPIYDVAVEWAARVKQMTPR